MRLEQFDRRQETAALQPVAVQVVGLCVGRRNQGNAAREQAFEEAAEEHGIADVAHEEFVETKDASFTGDVGGNTVQRVGDAVERGEACMDVGHDAVKMIAALRRQIQRFEEEVHQEGLAAADLAPDVHPAPDVGVFLCTPSARQPRPP